MGDNSFLRDLRARMFSSRRAMSWSMILRATPPFEAFVSSRSSVGLAIFDPVNISSPHSGYLKGMLVQSSGTLSVNDLQCCDTLLKLIQDSGL